MPILIIRITMPGSEDRMQVDGEQGTVLDRVKSHAFDVHARTDYVAPGEQRTRFGRMQLGKGPLMCFCL